MHSTVYVGSGDDGTDDADDGDGDTTSVGGTGDPSEGDSDPLNFQPLYKITLGHVVVTDEETGEPLVQWKAKADGETAISDDPMAAVMGAIEGQEMDTGSEYGVTD